MGEDKVGLVVKEGASVGDVRRWSKIISEIREKRGQRACGEAHAFVALRSHIFGLILLKIITPGHWCSLSPHVETTRSRSS